MDQQISCDGCQKSVAFGEYIARPSALDLVRSNVLDAYGRNSVTTLTEIAHRRLAIISPSTSPTNPTTT